MIRHGSTSPHRACKRLPAILPLVLMPSASGIVPASHREQRDHPPKMLQDVLVADTFTAHLCGSSDQSNSNRNPKNP